MASLGQITFWSMITIIIILVAVIVLIIGFGVSGRRSISVTTLTSAGNIGEDGILGCTFEPDIKLSNIEIRWAKAGVSGMVHEFKGGKDHLNDQDEVFKGRTAIFAEQVIGGNASLMLRDVQLSDAGAYRCSVTTSKGNGEAGLEYKTGAFSSPEMHVDYNSSMDTLRCEAPRWFPQPVVIWTSNNNTRDNLSEVSNTSFKLNSENVTMNVVSVLHNITANTTYTCVIKNDIAKATGDIKVTDSSIKKTVHLQLLTMNMASASLSPLALYWILLSLLYLMAL
ncbi:V-set domain-containing T-cell activation inhibitor 1 [Platysternon megacephalum]|uniref:V-set domain-containing T-cell activation inhibitor 1 n=1 Tax=Platysternon megacephalum TaxID=55544 RepID=A0A4D9E6A8_9SAUR|nr:V-set domain-containing T-cell activation inhibitor 1 [Platysternon megacephalum]